MSPYVRVTPPRRSSTPPGRPAPAPANPPAADEAPPQDTLPKIDAQPVDPRVAMIAVVSLVLLVAASIVLALLPPVVAAWVMGGLLVLVAAWAGWRLLSGRGIRLGGRNRGGRAGGLGAPGRAGGRSLLGGGSLLGGRARLGGLGLGRAGNGRFARLSGRVGRAASRRFPRASQAAARAAGRARAGASRFGRAASRAAARVPRPKRWASQAARAARKASGPSGPDQRAGGTTKRLGGRPGRPGGRGHSPGGRSTSSGDTRRRKQSSGPDRSGGGKGSGSVLGTLARIVKQLVPDPSPTRDKKPPKSTAPDPEGDDPTVTVDDELDDEDELDDDPADEADEAEGLSRAERLWYGLLDRARFWGKAAIEPALPAPPDLEPFEAGIETGPPPDEDWDIHPPASMYKWPDQEPAADPEPAPPEPDRPSPNPSSHRTDLPKPPVTISTRSTTMSVDVSQFEHYFAEATTPALLAQAYSKASDDAFARSNIMEEQAQELHAAARAAVNLPDAASGFKTKAADRERDRDSYRRLATHWRGKALELSSKTA